MFVLLKSTQEGLADVMLCADNVESFVIARVKETFVLRVRMQVSDIFYGHYNTIDEAKQAIRDILQAREKGMALYTRETKYLDAMTAVVEYVPVVDGGNDGDKSH